MNKLQLLTGDELSTDIDCFSEAQLELIYELANKALIKERHGMDSLFDSMTHTMKYIPNFLLQALTLKFIEPPIAARITERLEFKQTVAVAKGIKAEYLAEVSAYLDSGFAVKLLEALPKRLSETVIHQLVSEYPFKLHDMCGHFTVIALDENQEAYLRERLG